MILRRTQIRGVLLAGAIVLGMMTLNDIYVRFKAKILVSIQQLSIVREQATAVLAQEPEITRRFELSMDHFAPLFQRNDVTVVMGELDGLAKAAGVRVNMIRPVSDSKGIAMNFSGSWGQVTSFFRDAESDRHLFEFIKVSMILQAMTGELDVSVEAQRCFFAKGFGQ